MSASENPEDLFFRDVDECDEVEIIPENGNSDAPLMHKESMDRHHSLVIKDNEDWTAFLKSAEELTMKLTDISTLIVEPLENAKAVDLGPSTYFCGIIESCFSTVTELAERSEILPLEHNESIDLVQETVRNVVSEMLDALEHLNEFHRKKSAKDERLIIFQFQQPDVPLPLVFDEGEDIGVDLEEVLADESVLSSISADIERHTRRIFDVKVLLK